MTLSEHPTKGGWLHGKHVLAVLGEASKQAFTLIMINSDKFRYTYS